jgi:hypothetical protein
VRGPVGGNGPDLCLATISEAPYRASDYLPPRVAVLAVDVMCEPAVLEDGFSAVEHVAYRSLDATWASAHGAPVVVVSVHRIDAAEAVCILRAASRRCPARFPSSGLGPGRALGAQP